MSSTQTTPRPATTTGVPARDLRGFWRVLFAVLAPVAPLAAMLGALIQPWKYSAEPKDMIASIAANPGAQRIATVPERGRVCGCHVRAAARTQ